MSYDAVRDFTKIQSFKELQERNAKLVAILEEVIPLLEEQGYKPEAKRAREAIAR